MHWITDNLSILYRTNLSLTAFYFLITFTFSSERQSLSIDQSDWICPSPACLDFDTPPPNQPTPCTYLIIPPSTYQQTLSFLCPSASLAIHQPIIQIKTHITLFPRYFVAPFLLVHRSGSDSTDRTRTENPLKSDRHSVNHLILT
jgi:hypothetical protein